MKLEVKRHWFTSQSTIGQMFVDGAYFCFTLEPVTLEHSSVKPRAIACGTYPVNIRHSERFGRELPHVDNVPDFEAVEIHIGNYPRDTHGCTCVGQVRSEDFIGNSKVMFEKLFLVLSACKEPIEITYTEERIEHGNSANSKE